MKPLQIGLLVVAGALCGAVVMKVVERPKSGVPVVTAEAPREPVPTAPPVSAPPAEPVAATPVPAAEPETVAPAPAVAAAPREVRKPAVERPSPFAEHRVKPRPVWQPRPQPPMTARVTMPPVPAPAAVPQPTRRETPPPVAAPAVPQLEPSVPSLPPAREPENATPPDPVSPPAGTAMAAPESTPQAAPPIPEPNRATLSAGLLIPVRLADGLTSERNQPGDTFHATLEKELVADGFVIAERGARVEGVVVASDRGGKVSGVASLAVALTRIHTSDGQVIAVQTDAFNRHADQTHRQDAEKIGGAAAFGAIIGALAGGGKGAAAGAGVGAGAGAGAVVLTRGAAAALPAETRIAFRLKAPVTITERR